jgi:hypothetical protein
MLAQAAVTTDHLPAVQSSFLNKLLDIRTNEHYRPAAYVPDPIDFQAFADSLMSDRSKSLWPPSRPRTPDAGTSSNGQDTAEVSSDFTMNTYPGSTEMQPPAFSQMNGNPGSANPGTTNSQYDMASVISAMGPGPPDIPGAALGLSVGSFLSDQELLFSTDTFW